MVDLVHSLTGDAAVPYCGKTLLWHSSGGEAVREMMGPRWKSCLGPSEKLDDRGASSSVSSDGGWLLCSELLFLCAPSADV